MSAEFPRLIPGEARYFQDYGITNQFQIKATPGRIFAVSVLNYSATDKYLGLWNQSAGAPLGGALVQFCIKAGLTLTVGSEFFGAPYPSDPLTGGLVFSVGILWGYSTQLGNFVGAPILSGLTQIVYV